MSYQPGSCIIQKKIWGNHMKYKFLGTSPMTVDKKLVQNNGDIIETDKIINHPLFLIITKIKKKEAKSYAIKK